MTVDDLAQEIRRVDGNHSLGAGALAEALMPFITTSAAPDHTPALLALIEERDRLKVERDEAMAVISDELQLSYERLMEALTDPPKLRLFFVEHRVMSQRGALRQLNRDIVGMKKLLAAAEARALAAEAERDAAFAFIAKLVHMQSGQGWTRAVVRGAAANFLESQGISIAPGVDTTPEMVTRARALTQEQPNVGE